jgi:hypothetical protein
MSAPKDAAKPSTPPAQGITRITVQGFKSLANETSVEIRPLTILAGANSSGKSSIMQPILLLKQTLEAPYDPGPLLLDGSHVRFTSPTQFLSRPSDDREQQGMSVGMERVTDLTVPVTASFGVSFASRSRSDGEPQVYTSEVTYSRSDRTGKCIWHPVMERPEIEALAAWSSNPELPQTPPSRHIANWHVEPNRFFLEAVVSEDYDKPVGGAGRGMAVITSSGDALQFSKALIALLHIPGLRGLPGRAYPFTGNGPQFPGPFDPYTASIIDDWQEKGDGRASVIGTHLESLGLTWTVKTRRILSTQIEVLVGRLPHRGRSGADDLVNIADVGFGVSQVLPVLVALLAAEPGRLVYLEQPELHLHPKAQVALAGILAEAAKRGVRVVAETHSALLLLAIQTLVAEAKLPPEDVILHWFERGKDGVTKVTPAELDEDGAFGDWPEDFGEVELRAESRYLDAAEARLREQANAD